jgi:hypothetical protein
VDWKKVMAMPPPPLLPISMVLALLLVVEAPADMPSIEPCWWWSMLRCRERRGSEWSGKSGDGSISTRLPGAKG